MSEPPSVKVCIDTPPLAITVEAPGISIDEASTHALTLFRACWRDEPNRLGGGVGFTAERSGD